MRETCKDCKGPREEDSPAYSYCKKCNNARQRSRYAKRRQSIGLSTTSTAAATDHPLLDTPEERRRQRLLRGAGRPGRCDVCHEDTTLASPPLPLRLVQSSSTPDDPDSLYAGVNTTDVGLWCPKCDALLMHLRTPELLARAALLHIYLTDSNTPPNEILPDPNVAMFNKVPKPITITPTQPEQKATK